MTIDFGKEFDDGLGLNCLAAVCMVDGGKGLQCSNNDLGSFGRKEGNELFDDRIGYVEFDVEKKGLDGSSFCGRATCYTLFDNGLDSRCASAKE